MKIPSEAQCVFKGIIFDVYQWQQQMFDGSYATFEMLKRVNTVEIIAIQDGKICIAHQSQPTKKDFYSLLGGRAEPDEEPLVSAKRELLEESGLISTEWALLKTYQPSHKIDWNIYTYVAKNCKKVAAQTLDVGEQIELQTYTFDEFINIILSEKYWGSELALDILRMKDKGTLEEFKNKLLN